MKHNKKKEPGQAPEMKYAGKVEVLSSKSSFLLAVDPFTAESKKRYFSTTNGEAIDQAIAIFHPPPAAS